MLTNYVKIALRNFKRQKLYAFINVSGLTISLAACLLIVQYASFELSYDTFHEHAADLYRLTNDRYQNGTLTQHGVITYPSVGRAMKAEYPEVVNYTRLADLGRMYLQHEDTGFEEENLIYADSAFLSMFSFPLIEGDARTALAQPYSVLLSESNAAKYFGPDWRNREILGRTLTVDHRFDLTVTGVFEDVPKNTHMQFDLLASYTTLGKEYGEGMENSWTNSNFWTYLQLAPGTHPAALQHKFADFSERHFQGTTVSGSVERFFLQPLPDIHLYSDYEYERWVHGDGTAVWAMLVIAAFILVIAWVNYVNLSTARALERAREVGVRKVVGAERQHLLKQFLVEAALLNGLGLGTALLIAYGAHPLLRERLGITFSSTFLPAGWAVAFVLVFVAGVLVSGLYPALMLSSFKPVAVLKGQLVRSSQGAVLRKGLVIVQFALSFGLIAGTFAVYQQIRFMKDQDLGMNIDQMLVIDGPRLTPWDSTYFSNVGSFKNEVERIPGVRRATASQRLPGRRTGRIFDVRRVSDASDVQYTTSDMGVDHDFFETFEMKILAGRGFNATDHHFSFDAVRNIVINESTVHLLGFDDAASAVHERLRFWNKEWEVVGVVADHFQESLKVKKEPIIFLPLYSTGNNFFLKVSPQQLPRTLAAVEKTYLAVFPGNTFDYFFLDAYFDAQYDADRRFRNLFSLFTGLGIVLACLGLFGLSVLATGRRTKEIGIRKVLGASVPGLLGLLTMDFVKLVLIATVIACPLTYLVMTAWLSGYAYHIDVAWPLFALPGLFVLLIAVVTVGFQTLKAALADPVKSLRYE